MWIFLFFVVIWSLWNLRNRKADTNIRMGAVDQQGHTAKDPIILETELLEAGNVRKSDRVRKEPVWLKDYTS